MYGAKTKVTVKILDEEYNIKGDAAPEYVAALAGYVDRKMRQITEGEPRIAGNKAAVLAALQIADELFKLQRKYEDLTGRQSEKRNI